MEQLITCINCPIGCLLTVDVENGEVVEVSGNSCKRGIAYAAQESIAPKRMVTAVIPVQERKMPLSVKTQRPIPKEKIAECMQALANLSVVPPIVSGAVVCADICDTGIDVIATKTIE